jgi:Domain of unknown function (DUF1918)
MRCGQVLVTHDGPGGAAREAEVVEVLGVNCGPPFRVRWLDTGRTSLLFPDSDVWTEPRTHPRVPRQRGNRCG